METLLALSLAIGLSAASGFRVFVPSLIMSGVARYSDFTLPGTLEWMEHPLAFYLLLAATLLEVGAYYVPWLDNLLDVAAAPAAVIAGTLLTGAFAVELDPVLRWSLALIAGGGAAGGVQALTSVTRLVSTGTTGGLGNPVVSTIENVAATGLSLIAIVLPFLALLLVGFLLVVAVRRVRRFRRKRVTA